MKTIVADRNSQVAPIATDLPKRTSLEADRELAHIQRVMNAVSATSASLPISACYWKTRLGELRNRYTLLAVQLARLSELERFVDDIEQRSQADNGAKLHAPRGVEKCLSTIAL